MQTNAPILLFSLLFAQACPAIAQEDSRWIVTGTDAAASMTSKLGMPGLTSVQRQGFSVGDSGSGRTVAKLARSLEDVIIQTMHEEHHRCGGFTLHPSLADARDELNNPFYEQSYLNRRLALPTELDQQEIVVPMLANVDRENIITTIRLLEDKGTRYYQSDTGRDAALELKTQWQQYGAGRDDFSVTTYIHSWKQPSVIASIVGAELPDEIVVVGGHLDSINGTDPNNAPGADDNGSGIAVASEVLRVILDSGFRPKRTLQFIAYAAEEVGLRGSQGIAEQYRDDSKNVVAALQFDMTGFSGSPADMYFVTDYVSTDLTNFLKRLIGKYNQEGEHKISFGETVCGYACSDHASWTRTGVPAAFPFETRFDDYNKAIHSPNDLLTKIDQTGHKQVRFAKLGIEFMVEIAKSSDATQPGATVRHGYAWAHNATLASYTPKPGYSANSAGGAITATRLGAGRYVMTFDGLGGGSRAGGNVQVTSYGAAPNQCKVSSWKSAAMSLQANVRCFQPNGLPIDQRYSILVNWP